MKITTSPDHSRYLVVSELPAAIARGMPSIEVEIRYRGDSNASTGIIIDHAVVPLFRESANLLAALVELVKSEEARWLFLNMPIEHIQQMPYLKAARTAITRAVEGRT